MLGLAGRTFLDHIIELTVTRMDLRQNKVQQVVTGERINPIEKIFLSLSINI